MRFDVPVALIWACQPSSLESRLNSPTDNSRLINSTLNIIKKLPTLFYVDITHSHVFVTHSMTLLIVLRLIANVL